MTSGMETLVMGRTAVVRTIMMGADMMGIVALLHITHQVIV